MEKDAELRTYLEDWDCEIGEKSIEQQCKDYDDYEVELDLWNKRAAPYYAEKPDIGWDELASKIGKCPWPGPKSCKNPYRPGGLYECMIKRLLPYSLRGFIWYQGESDDHKPYFYEKLFGTLIHKWREDWCDEKLPFLFVQLPGHRYKQDKDFKHWCLIRQAQEKVFTGIKNTGMACALDLGDFNDIHPRGKKVVAERLALGAMNVAYNLIEETDAFAPKLKDALSVSGENGACGKVVLTFDFVKDGFVVREDKKRLEELRQMEEIAGEKLAEDFTGFEIAGEDGMYYPAEFEFDKCDCSKIILSSKKVENPVNARYAWFNYGPVTIFEKNGLPLAPFRTCKMNDAKESSHAEIQQIMTV
jgi:sialate O-acetylesterase